MKRWLHVKSLLMVILVLNSLDGIFTSWGLLNGWIEEANPLLSSLSPLSLLLVKLILSGFVFILWKSNFPSRFVPLWRGVLFFVVMLYIWIFFLHIFWMALVW